MSQDVYQPCPCGSGKKLKFCCLDIADEMMRAIRLHDTNQPRLALQTVEKLKEQHPDLPWVYIGLATGLLDEHRPDEAKQILAQLLLKQPDHPLGIALNALAVLQVDGYDRSKAALYRAFQRCGRAFPEIISGLAVSVATIMMARRRSMACRQYLTLAMRLASGETKQEIFVRLLEFDNDSHIPYPLRSVHLLVNYTGTEEASQQARQAVALSGAGCFEAAARLYARLAEQQPESSVLCLNWGLCLAWSGDEAGAAVALHRAAASESNRPAAVEFETLAQLLEMNTGKDAVKLGCWEYQVASVSRLLTLLEHQERFVRFDIDTEEAAGISVPAAAFQVLDRSEKLDAPLSLDNVPIVIGELSIYDAHPDQDQPARALLVSPEGEQFEQAQALCQQVFGAEVSHSALSDRAAHLEPIPHDLLALQTNWHFPSETRPPERREFLRRRWEHVVSETWPTTKLASLGGQTPREAAADPSLRVKLLAAVYVFDAFCEQQEHVLDLNALCQRLGIEPLPPLEIDEQMSINACSAMQMIRLPVERLTDDQLTTTLNRALLVNPSRFVELVLKEVLKRPSCVEKVDLDRVYNTLVDLSVKQFRPDEAVQWLARARASAEGHENAFDLRLRCDLRELAIRLNNPDDPQLAPLLERFGSYYLPKLPTLRENLEQLLAIYGIEPPWPGAMLAEPHSVAASAGGGGGGGGIWTPDAAPESTTAGKKLWIPGAD